MNDSEFRRRARDLAWILCDVDGVLTDGGLYYDGRGHRLLRFNAKDGLGLKLAQRAGLKVGFLSGRGSKALDRRAADLGLDAVYAGVDDKGARLDVFLAQHAISARRVAYVGDDLSDLVVLGRVGLAFAPADAVTEVRAVAHRVLSTPGGGGAAREMVEMILRARGDWQTVLAPFSFEG